MPPNYCRQNLCGRSFKGEDLSEADFSGKHIHGTDFTGATLRGANFTGVRGGLQLRWKIFLIVGSFFMSGLSGAASGLAGANTLISILNPHDKLGILFQILPITIVSIESLVFFTITILKGFKVHLAAVAATLASALAILDVVLYLAKGKEGLRLGEFTAFQVAAVGGWALTGIVLGTLSIVGVWFLYRPAILTIVVSWLTGLAVAVNLSLSPEVKFWEVMVIVTTAGIWPVLCAYISRQALAGDEKFTLMRDFAIVFAAIQGTSFRNADLTDADFTKATLKNTDFRKATLTRTCFHDTEKLDLIRPENTYLENTQVRQLLVSGKAQNKNFDGQNLRGVNLQEANLVDASFIGTDLSEACLQDADLSRAILKQTQLDKTDFTGATLTGAFIEDWNITHETNFRGLRCEYVYMRLPTKENPNPLRKPDNNTEVFADGEFGDFIQPIFDTLDLYHNQGVDPRAIAISFKELAENNPDVELEIVGIEKRGENKILIRVKTAITANKSELSKEYFLNYNQLKSLAEEDFNALIREKDSRILQLENMIMTALKPPSFHFKIDNKTDNSAVKTILILASNPKNTSQLRLDEEVREIDAGLQRAKKRELFDLKQRWAVRYQEVYQALLDFKPQIVHFIGHGSGDDGLALEDENGNLKLVDTEAIAELFGLFSNKIECVVLNACYSEVQAIAIAKYIPYVIGMNQAIGDKAAIKFATGFYDAIGAGESVEFAYKLGCNVIQSDRIPEHLTPVLKKRQTI